MGACIRFIHFSSQRGNRCNSRPSIQTLIPTNSYVGRYAYELCNLKYIVFNKFNLSLVLAFSVTFRSRLTARRCASQSEITLDQYTWVTAAALVPAEADGRYRMGGGGTMAVALEMRVGARRHRNARRRSVTPRAASAGTLSRAALFDAMQCEVRSASPLHAADLDGSGCPEHIV